MLILYNVSPNSFYALHEREISIMPAFGTSWRAQNDILIYGLIQVAGSVVAPNDVSPTATVLFVLVAFR